MADKKLSGEGEPKFSDLKKWFENFWYHYKAHTIIGAVALVTLVICITQIATREEADFHLLYAGPQNIAYRDKSYMQDAIEAVADDYNSDGEVVAAFSDIVMLSPEEREVAAENGAVFDNEFIMSSLNEFDQHIMNGETVICLLSPYMYARVPEGGFLPLADVLDEVPEGTYDEYAIYLSKTEFGQYFEGMNDLPEDTLLCVRRLATTSIFTGKKKAEKAHAANARLFKKIVEFEAPEEADTTVSDETTVCEDTTVTEETTATEDTTVADDIPVTDDVTVVDIVDRTKTEMLATADALEGFFSDDEYTYYFPSIKSHYITVHYSDGTSENIKDAFGVGRVTIADLDKFDIGYYAEPKVTDLEYKATFIRADSMSDDAYSIFWQEHSENPSSIAISSTQHILVAHIADEKELSALYNDISQHYQTNISYNNAISFDEHITAYDESFFAEKSLLILALQESSGSISHEVEFVRGRKSPLVYACIKRIIPDFGTADMADWFAFIEVSKSDLENALDFDAWYYR